MSAALFVYFYDTRRCSWHNLANVMYVDQPVGTGLSFTTRGNYADNDLQVRCAVVLVMESNGLDILPRADRAVDILFLGCSHVQS